MTLGQKKTLCFGTVQLEWKTGFNDSLYLPSRHNPALTLKNTGCQMNNARCATSVE